MGGMSFEEAKAKRDNNPIWSAFTSGYGGGAAGAVGKAGASLGARLAGKVAAKRVKNTTVQQGPPFGGATRRISPNPRASVKSKARREELARKKGGRLQGPKTASQQRVDELFGVGNRPL